MSQVNGTARYSERFEKISVLSIRGTEMLRSWKLGICNADALNITRSLGRFADAMINPYFDQVADFSHPGFGRPKIISCPILPLGKNKKPRPYMF